LIFFSPFLSKLYFLFFLVDFFLLFFFFRKAVYIKRNLKKNASCLPFSKFYPHNDLKKKIRHKKVTSNFIYCTHIYTHANAHTLNELHCQKTSHTSTSTCDVLLIITLPFIFASDIYHCQFYILEGSHDALHSYDLRICI